MDKKNSDVNLEDTLPKEGSGSILATARKEQNKTVEEIAAVLNLSVTQIKTIELDQTEGLPEPTYVRGYIRAYAKLLGLDPEQVLKNYLNPSWQKNQSLDDIPKHMVDPRVSKKRKGKGFKWFLLLLVLMAVLASLWHSGSLLPFFENRQTVVEQTEPNEGEAVSTPVTVQQDSVAETAAEADKHILTLTLSDTSWVDIRDAADNRLAYKSYVQGEELTVSSQTPMSVFIGNAAGVSVNYNETPFDITPYQEGVYAKFVVGEK